MTFVYYRTLRILFSEPEKIKERQKFKRLFKEYNGIQKATKKCQKAIDAIVDEYDSKIGDIESKLQAVLDQSQNNSGEIASLKKEIIEMEDTVTIEKKASITNYFRYLFGRLPSQKKAKKCKSDLIVKENDVLQAEYLKNELLQSKEKLGDEVDQQTKGYKENLAQLNAEAKNCSEELANYADGRIIGDGRADFTRTVTSYGFNVNNQDFALLDLPGIEGNEKLVLNNINAAVQKAHAVFFVTGKPTPPQTGDKGVKGTLEKIKKHLGQQTEVFTIFNKRINNPNSFKEGLVDEGEINSLKVLDMTMREHLGEQYQHCISLSAYPAFLVNANCWQGRDEAMKKNFMEHFETPERLMEKTKVPSFASWLSTDMVSNCKAKIKKSNFKKAVTVLNYTAENIKQIHENFTELQQKFIKEKKPVDAQLDDSMEILKNRFDAETHIAVEYFKNNVRVKIYKDIEGEIDNAEFKKALEDHLEEGVEELQRILNKNIYKAIDDFKDNVSKIVDIYQRYTAELLAVYNAANKFNKNFEINIDIKSRVNWRKLLNSIVKDILGVLKNLSGWYIYAISAIQKLIGAIVAHFDHKYRKSQQRKSADENIKQIGKDILKSIRENLAKAHEPLQTRIDDLKNDLMKDINSVKIINAVLANAESRLAKLALAVKTEGDR